MKTPDNSKGDGISEFCVGGQSANPGNQDRSRFLFISLIAFSWSLFQLWLASPLPFILGVGIFSEMPARAIHLSFALLLCFLMFPIGGKASHRGFSIFDLALALLSVSATFYLVVFQEDITGRVGVLWVSELFGTLVPVEAVVGGIGVILLLEATRRAIGPPLVIICYVFILFSLFGQSMPDLIAHKGLSLERLIGYQWFTGEAIFGIPIDVSVSFVFLFVLFGALLDRAGAGKYFLDLAFSMVGQYRGGPAKAAILASGMNGAISGSSVANVVTTGTFTIPVMRRIGIPAIKAGAIEVAASTNGQIMPPIMGAAAFIIAETIGISYFDVVMAALIPALISYFGLFYISHLEALKLGLRGLPRETLNPFWSTLKKGFHFFIPVVVLVWLLMVERWTPGSSVFYSNLVLMVIILGRQFRRSSVTSFSEFKAALSSGLTDIFAGLVAGARNMVGIAVAVAAAGIVVGSVASTGLNNAMVGVVEAASGGNIYLLLFLTAALCIVLGMGLPTTANYLVVATLLSGVLVELGGAAGLVLPLIAVHLFVFYFGLLADSTPPVCLAAYAASAISGADPLRTGLQSFFYDIRTAILPFVFIFNTELLLIGVKNVWHGISVFLVSLLAILCFSSLTQWWLFSRLRVWEGVCLFLAMISFFRPDFIMEQIHPEFSTIDIVRLQEKNFSAPADQVFRIHVVRETDYGDRYKLFRIQVGGDSSQEPFGFQLGKPKDDRYPVEDVSFNGAAYKVGIRAYQDFVTAVDMSNPGRPNKEWVYLFGFICLGAAFCSQWRRKPRSADPNLKAINSE
ncbi:MAG: TRAP transporter fused permease subunit [Rhodospirillaceae bacterium]